MASNATAVLPPINCAAIEVLQPIGCFYIAAIGAADLVSISYADIRRPEGRAIEKYIGTQRDLNETRVEEIKQYVTNVDACFPTGVILSISSKHAQFNPQTGKLQIQRVEDVAKIIDGQHRIAGLEGYAGAANFQINVTIFIDMDIEDQAMTFAIINLKQTRVSKSLAYDLYEYAESRSPQKTCHNIAKLMHAKENSPLYGRIKILGKADRTGQEIISQATFVDRLIRLISRNPMLDRDKIKRQQPLERPSDRWKAKLVFRNNFIDDQDAVIAKTFWNYLAAVRARWPDAWDNRDQGMVLARSTGFAALVRLLPRILDKLNSSGIPSESQFAEYFKKSTLTGADFTSQRFPPGSSGESALFKELEQQIITA